MKTFLQMVYIFMGCILGVLMLAIPVFVFGFVIEMAKHFTKLLLN